MTDVVGGLRARLIRQSLYEYILNGLDALGWFDPTRPHLRVVFESKGQNTEDEIAFNTSALSDENDRESGWELGSNLTENTWQFYVDFFAESDALGLHFIQDVRDLLRGRFTSIGYGSESFDVYDYRQATPPVIFRCDIENVDVDKAHGFLKPWLQHWYECAFDVVDNYADELFTQPVLGTEEGGDPILIV